MSLMRIGTPKPGERFGLKLENRGVGRDGRRSGGGRRRRGGLRFGLRESLERKNRSDGEQNKAGQNARVRHSDRILHRLNSDMRRENDPYYHVDYEATGEAARVFPARNSGCRRDFARRRNLSAWCV